MKRRTDFDYQEYIPYVDMRPQPAQEDIKEWKKKDRELPKAIIVITLIFMGGYGLLVLMTKLAEILG